MSMLVKKDKARVGGAVARATMTATKKAMKAAQLSRGAGGVSWKRWRRRGE